MAKRVRFANWGSLIDELLGLVLDKLVYLRDYIRFSAVCKSWNSVASNRREKRPWLLISSSDKDNGRRKLSVYNFISDEIIKLRIPYKYKIKRCSGSSHGWLFFVESVSTLVVLNPFSGDIIQLPPLKSVDIINNGLGKVILSKDPSLGVFEVLATSSCSHVVAHLKFGDDFWAYSNSIPHTNRPRCLIFYKNLILGASPGGGILSLQVTSFDDIHSSSSRCIKVEKIIPDLNNNLDLVFSSSYFVLETTECDLIMVERHSKFDFKQYSTFKIIVSNGQVLDRTPVVNLGGHSLFLGNCNDSISVLASDYGGCRSNSIYYCYSYTMFKKHLVRRRVLKYGRIEEFNLDDQSFQYYQKFSMSHEASWIVPSMSLLKVYSFNY
ncbi:hypothetical protein FNV43_RR00709 [Rhamnella rubrinervis]|uniref:DUF295 domain-containing protein n=1 Tax=Rhamnella rubrinervis TaxID=2594499 RepID=A0A8K0MRE8_9ROSA|nr:hypothetical protein FNV43_RR00709 [Rhamnella rubrinervis]